MLSRSRSRSSRRSLVCHWRNLDTTHRRYSPLTGWQFAPILISRQLEFLDDAGLLEDGYSFPRISADTPISQAIPKEFITVFRALRLSPVELATFRSNNKLPKGPLTTAEARLLCDLFRQRLEDYPTSLENDAQLLAGANGQQITDVSQRRRLMAVQVRHGEKETLAQYIAALDTYIAQCPPDRDNKRPNDSSAMAKNAKRRMA